MAGKNWRDRLHDKRPKTALQPISAASDSTGPNPETSGKPGFERTRSPAQLPEKPSNRRTYHGSRPQTPLLVPALTISGGDDLDEYHETRSDIGSEAVTSRRKSGPRPKLSRYISDYLSLSNAPKASDVFSEFWTENVRPIVAPPPDPNIALQAARSHIANMPSKSLPTEHNSGILHIFEDYRKVREEGEKLEAMLHETREAFELSKDAWAATEGRYQEEIRRLDLIIAQGRTGMAALMKARQGSLVDRRRAHRKTLSTDRPLSASELNLDQIDEQIRLRCQKVVLQRPLSPSNMMASLSKQFGHAHQADEFPIGTPPDTEPGWTLSRKVKSELDLAKMTSANPPMAQLPSGSSSPSLSGSPLPHDLDSSRNPAFESGIECEALVALRELASLVARRRGIDEGRFVSGLVALLSATGEATKTEQISDHGPANMFSGGRRAIEDAARSPGRAIRRYQSQPHLTTDRNRRRHFSFEPGDDQLGTLHEELQRFKANRERSPAGSQSTRSSGFHDATSDVLSDGTPGGSHALNTGTPRPSKIPSPLSRPGLSHVRRENSNSSLQTVTRLRLDNRRGSRSSVLTALRDNSSGNLRRHQSNSKSSSHDNVHEAETTERENRSDSLRVRSGAVGSAMTRAEDTASSSSLTSGTTTRRGVLECESEAV